jgi:phage FluMu gp28-like protein
MLLPKINIEADESVSAIFLPYQLNWIFNDAPLRLAEKSVRIGWTFADAFKNVRKRLLYPRRDYLFSSKDQTTAIEYVNTCYQFCEVYNHTRSVLSHGVEDWKVPIFRNGKNTGFLEDFKVGYIKFDNGSRILSFSSNPHALRAYGGDVGLDEFAFHADPETLWGAASGRITWGFDLAIWSSHNGNDSLFYTLCREAASGPAHHEPRSSRRQEAHIISSGGSQSLLTSAATDSVKLAKTPWSHYRVMLMDAVKCGLVEKINQVRGSKLTRAQFIANCKTRARLPEVFEQEYMCNPCGGTSGIVPWSAMERCMMDYEIERLHLEEKQVLQHDRESRIRNHILQAFQQTIAGTGACSSRREEAHFSVYKRSEPPHVGCYNHYRLGFDVAASGRGDLTVIYIDRVNGNVFELAALFTCRTQDWHFIKTVLFTFMRELRSVQACGDETGLGRQICWEAAQQFCGKFQAVNFSSEKSDIGFTLMNQLAVAEKRFPRSHRDVASDFFALRKHYTGAKWLFTEGTNPLNAASHCDIAWAGGLASKANRVYRDVGGAVA